MPIRFVCPRCQQKLSVASRKAGTPTICPRCQEQLTIPDRPAAPADVEVEYLTSAADDEGDPVPVVAPVVAPDAAPPIALAAAGEAAPSVAPAAPPVAASVAGWERVPALARPDTSTSAPREPPNLMIVPRHIVYLQGGLLAAAAYLGLLIGWLLGTTSSRPAHTEAQSTPCRVSGSVMYAAGARMLPDAGAVVIFVPPLRQRPDEKAPIIGIRPADPPQAAAARGAVILKQLGGGYARTDSGGRYEVELPSSGRYLVLALSHETKSRGENAVAAADVVRIKPFFDSPVALLTGHRYYLAEEHIRGDRELAVEFP